MSPVTKVILACVVLLASRTGRSQPSTLAFEVADTFVVDGQPISDQQSKAYSTQLPTTAVQSMELITGIRMRSLATKQAW